MEERKNMSEEECEKMEEQKNMSEEQKRMMERFRKWLKEQDRGTVRPLRVLRCRGVAYGKEAPSRKEAGRTTCGGS